MAVSNDQLVLVTGGSGFLAAWCIVKLLDAGYRVRTSLRSLKRENEVRDMLKTGGATKLDKVSFVVADLTADEGWKEAVEGCTYVLHVASPFPTSLPKNEDDLIIPAREGTLRVLRAARDAGVKRVVVTSSFAAIGYGHGHSTRTYSEKDWSNTKAPDLRPYQKSKTLAEQAAWDFIKNEGGSLELSVINPVGIFGPVLGKDLAASIVLIKRLLNAEMPGCPHLYFGVVDVRDAADAHLLAMTHPKAAGERFLAAAPPEMSILDMSKALRAKVPELAKKTPTREVPNFLVRLVALWDEQAALITGDLGMKRSITNEKAKSIFGWQPIPAADALAATAESLAKLGLLKL